MELGGMKRKDRAAGHAQTRAWRPVLEKELCESAIRIVSSVARELRKTQVRNATLALGNSGIALLFAYLPRAQPGHDNKEIAVRFLERAARGVSANRMSASLYSGFTGVAWTTIHLKRLLCIEGEYPTAKIDRALAVYLRSLPWRGQYELINGLIGLGVYALECLPRSTAATLLERIVDHLDEGAEWNCHGCAWPNRNQFLSANWGKCHPNGCYDLGMAHGAPGIVAMLGRVCGTKEEKLKRTRAKARRLLDGAVSWLLAQKSCDSKLSIFPTCVAVTPGPVTGASRLAWCYGDLGIATGLLIAARSVNESAWEVEAVSLARHAAKRSFQQSGVKDTGLCHGAVGVGHLFNRFYQNTGGKIFRDAARYWFQQTIKMRRVRWGVAGFPVLGYGRIKGNFWNAEPGLLYGAAGVALALLSAATPVEPAWDRTMLASM